MFIDDQSSVKVRLPVTSVPSKQLAQGSLEITVAFGRFIFCVSSRCDGAP